MIGVPIIGENVAEMLPRFAVAVKMGVNRTDLQNSVAIHPGSAEELASMGMPEPQPVDSQSINAGIVWRKASWRF